LKGRFSRTRTETSSSWGARLQTTSIRKTLRLTASMRIHAARATRKCRRFPTTSPLPRSRQHSPVRSGRFQGPNATPEVPPHAAFCHSGFSHSLVNKSVWLTGCSGPDVDKRRRSTPIIRGRPATQRPILNSRSPHCSPCARGDPESQRATDR